MIIPGFSVKKSCPVNAMTPEKIARRIIELFPRTPKDRDSFRVLIKTILSQRTRDENTDEASKRLFSRYKTVEDLAKASPEDLYDLIKPAGMYRQKAARIIEVSRKILKDFSGKVPDSLEDLTKLPGVGRKTANIVLWVSFKKPAIAVDTHVHRISNRLGLVKTKKPEETEVSLMKILPRSLWGPLNGSMVEFGRRICKPQSPKCSICPLKDECDYYHRFRASKSKENSPG